MKKTRKILALGLSFVMMLGLCLTAGTVNATGDINPVSDIDELQKAIAGATPENPKVIEIDRHIDINRSMDIANVEIVDVRTGKSSGHEANLICIDGQYDINFTNVEFKANDNTKSLLSINGGAKVRLGQVTFNHKLANGGAPIIINDKDTNVTFTGNLTMQLGQNSWYGVNVDAGNADFTNASIDCTTSDANNTQSVICTDNAGKVNLNNSSTLSTVTTAKNGEGENKPQVAYVKGDDLADFITAKQAKDVTDVVVKERVTLNKTLSLNEDMTINCEGDGAFVAGSNLNDNVVTVKQNATVELNNVKIETKVNAAKSGLHIYGGTVKAKDLTIINENTDKDGKGGGAAVVLNSGNLTLDGETTFQLGKDSWGGINIDNNIPEKTPKMTIVENATIDVKSPENSVKLYYVDTDEQDDIPLDETVVDLPNNYTFKINGITGTTDENGELKHAHKVNRVPAKEATYDATGNIEYWYCAGCDKYFADATLTKEISKTDTVIPKLEKPAEPEKETITITLKAIVDGKEVNLEELGLKPEQYILSVEKGIAVTADDLKVLDEMKESLSVDGYTFRGYFLDAKGTEALKADVPFNADATIYMIWDKEVDVTVTPNPGDTEKPNTEKPNTDNTNKPEQKPTETDKTVKTDDSSNAALYGLMISLSVVGAGIVVLAKKREKLLNK